MTAGDDILVVDNASNLPALTDELRSVAEREPRVRLLLRDTNDISRNGKVGGLYDAYNEVVSYALREGYDYLHIMQHDMQTALVGRERYAVRQGDLRGVPGVREYLHVRAAALLLRLSGNLEYVKPNLACLQDYGLTDTGLYDLERWRRLTCAFSTARPRTRRNTLTKGYAVFLHPTPAVV